MEQNNKVFQIQPKKQQIDSLTEEQIEEIKKKQDLELIILKGNSYSKHFFAQFSDFIKQSKDLQRVNANDIFVGRCKDEIPESLSTLGSSLIGLNIISIDLSNNAVNPFGAEAMKPFLKQAHKLERLYLNNCGLGIRGVTQIAEGLIEGGKALQILAIARNRAECDGAIEIAKATAHLKELKELHIYQNGIKQKGMIQLLDGLADNCQQLQLIDIRDNFIHKETTISFVNLLNKAQQLTQINISDCNIEVGQNKQILEGLTNVKEIQKLSYQYAEINDEQGLILYDIIVKQINNIKKLELKGNEFKKSTRTKFIELFKEKKESLGVFESEDEEDEADELSKMFSQLVL